MQMALLCAMGSANLLLELHLCHAGRRHLSDGGISESPSRHHVSQIDNLFHHTAGQCCIACRWILHLTCAENCQDLLNCFQRQWGQGRLLMSQLLFADRRLLCSSQDLWRPSPPTCCHQQSRRVSGE